LEPPKLKRKLESPTQPSPRKRLKNKIDVGYLLTSSIAVAALTSRYKTPAFRLEEEAVIARILAGGSTVVVFSTGGGKSLYYQVPAITFSEHNGNIRDVGEGGITLVV